MYVFVGRDSAGGGTAAYQCAEATLTTCRVTSGSATGTRQYIGSVEAAAGTTPVYDGTFDNEYYKPPGRGTSGSAVPPARLLCSIHSRSRVALPLPWAGRPQTLRERLCSERPRSYRRPMLSGD